MAIGDGWAYDDEGGTRGRWRDPGLYRYFERRRRRSTRTVIVIVSVTAIVAITPMLTSSIGASFPPKRWDSGPGDHPGRFV